MRYEIKVPIEKNLLTSFHNWINFKSKVYKLYDDRIINSIYYDNENYTCAKDNLSGISNRSKFRIRWYNQDKKKIRLEIKRKNNNFGRKIFLDCDLDIKEFKNFFSYKNEFLKEKKNYFFLSKLKNLDLKPKIQINYKRSYFMYDGKIRVTLDKNINYRLIKFDEFSNFLHNDDMCVVEIKFAPKDSHDALKIINNMPFYPKRFSKYLRGLYLGGIVNYI